MNTAIPSDVAVESTRERILHAAFEEMYEHGFQGLRIDAVLKKTQLAKGALYHYFPNKLALGYAILDEVIMGHFQVNWSSSLAETKNPLEALKAFFKQKLVDVQSGECVNGCPLTNLIQEMSTLDEGFHERLKTVLNYVVVAVATALQQGQLSGVVRKDIKPQSIAAFLLCSYQGVMGVTKCMQSNELQTDLFDSLCTYVDSLKA
jgi:TetR/AcrR family transcriptional regulator, transcriptional repressor for nem operon